MKTKQPIAGIPLDVKKMPKQAVPKASEKAKKTHQTTALFVPYGVLAKAKKGGGEGQGGAQR